MKITNSLTLKQLYRKRLRKLLQDKGIFIQETDIHRIVREKNKAITENILKGVDYRIPYKIGTLGLRKFELKPTYYKGNLVNLPPIDWRASIKLNKKVYSNIYTVFKVILIKKTSNYCVKHFWRFRFSTTINRRIYELATTNPNFDALKYVYNS